MRTYEYRHIVTFDETNLLGNVYFVNHVRWQGLCREMFIREHAPAVLEDLVNGLSLVTVRCACTYLAEVFAFDEIILRMRLSDLGQNRFTMTFEYIRPGLSGEEVVARGEQQIACLRRDGNRSVPLPAPIPAALREAFKAYAK